MTVLSSICLLKNSLCPKAINSNKTLDLSYEKIWEHSSVIEQQEANLEGFIWEMWVKIPRARSLIIIAFLIHIKTKPKKEDLGIWWILPLDTHWMTHVHLLWYFGSNNRSVLVSENSLLQVKFILSFVCSSRNLKSHLCAFVSLVK